MINMTTQVLFMKEKNYKVLDNLLVDININENPYSVPLKRVFSLAARNNLKRSYLFVSKLIGKHIPVRPQVPLLTGFLLASRLAEYMGLAVSRRNINEAVNLLSFDQTDNFQRSSYKFFGKALFIGFAETATALGHSVFDCFTGDIRYLHTTREDLKGSFDTIYFTEDHCHAPDQRCLVGDTYSFEDNDLLVLIDDEITSGNTCLNFIKTIQNKYRQKQYIILTILDWRSEEYKEKYDIIEQELGVEIKVLSLCAGNFCCQDTSPVIDEHLFSRESTSLIKETDLTKKMNCIEDDVSNKEDIFTEETTLSIEAFSKKKEFLGTGTYSMSEIFGREKNTAGEQIFSKETVFLQQTLILQVAIYTEPIGPEIEIDSPSGRKLKYLKYTGRFGIDVKGSNMLLSEAFRLGQKLSKLRKGKKTLCLGTGEFMYLPFLIAGNMGEGVWVQSTTRSPVQPHIRQDYAVQYAIEFTDPFRPDIKNFVYNIQPSYYDEVFIFWEREVKPESVEPLVQSLNKLGIENIVFVSHCR